MNLSRAAFLLFIGFLAGASMTIASFLITSLTVSSGTLITLGGVFLFNKFDEDGTFDGIGVHEVQAVIVNKETGLALILKRKHQTPSMTYRLVKGEMKTGETELEALSRVIDERLGLSSVSMIRKMKPYTYQNNKNEKCLVSPYEMDLSPYESEFNGDRRAESVNGHTRQVHPIWVNINDAMSLLRLEIEKKLVSHALGVQIIDEGNVVPLHFGV